MSHGNQMFVGLLHTEILVQSIGQARAPTVRGLAGPATLAGTTARTTKLVYSFAVRVARGRVGLEGIPNLLQRLFAVPVARRLDRPIGGGPAGLGTPVDHTPLAFPVEGLGPLDRGRCDRIDGRSDRDPQLRGDACT